MQFMIFLFTRACLFARHACLRISQIQPKIPSACYDCLKFLSPGLRKAYQATPLTRKLMLMTKLTCLLLLAFMQVSAAGYSQDKVTVDFKDAGVAKVFRYLERKSGYVFYYNNDELEALPKVTLALKDVPVSRVLDSIATYLSLHYNIMDHKLVVIRKSASMPVIRHIQGRVTDEKGEALVGVTVQARGSTTGTVTDDNGLFFLDVPDSATLVVSYVGYETRMIPVGEVAELKIVLKPSSSSLDEVVVIGYGSTRRSNITSAISSISANDIKDIPAAGVDQMLQGKVPGVSVTSNSGQPGGGVSVRVRGITSVTGSNEPLYVIDGQPILTNSTSIGQDQLGGVAGQTTQSILATLNPDDIASIDILKDATAQAIYGSLGANGVVEITTKHGQSGKGTISYNVYYGWQDIPKKLPLMNLRQYAGYFNSVVGEGTVSGLDTIGEFKTPSLLGAGTDWQDAVFQTGRIQNHQLSFSGGNGKTTYYFSGNYYDQKGTVIGSGFNRYAAKASVDQQVRSWLKAGVSANLSKTRQKITLTDGQQSVISLMMYNSPATPVKGFDGSYVSTTSIAGVPFGQTQNPVALAMLRDVHADQSKAFGNVYAEIHFARFFTLRNQFNYDFQLNQNTAFQPKIASATPGVDAIGPSRLREDRNTSFYWGLQNYLTFDNSFGKHHINVVVGHESQYSLYDAVWESVTDLTLNLESLSAGTLDASQTGGQKYPWAMESYFARANYSYDNRYSISLSDRRDGSSSFGPEKRWGQFPAASAGWTITNESFAKDMRVLNYLKLRLGVGAVGNQNVGGNNVYSTNIRLIPQINGLFGSSGVAGVPANVGNPYLSWESVVTYNIGLDATLLNNHIDLTIDAYKKKSSHMILSSILPTFAGLDPNPPNNSYQEIEPPVTNAGDMTNTGIDIGISSHNISNANFTWTTKLEFSHYKNVLNKLNSAQAALYGKSQDFAPVTLTVTKAGHQSVGSFYGFVTDGLYRSQKDLTDGPVPMLAVDPQGTWLGDIRYKDLDGNDTITTADQTYIGNPNPKFTYGITNQFTYKNFDLSIFLTGVYGDQIFNYTRTQTEADYNVYLNQLTTVINRYTVSNPNGKLPRYNQWNNNNLKISDRFIESGSYFRIQNISLGYNLPKKWISKIKMSSARIYASAQNVYTFTKYSGYDPELGSFNGNVLNMNIDYGHYPNPRSLTIGANIQF